MEREAWKRAELEDILRVWEQVHGTLSESLL